MTEDLNHDSDDTSPLDSADVPLLDRVIHPEEISTPATLPTHKWCDQLTESLKEQIRPFISQAVADSVTHLAESLADQIQVRIEEQIPEMIEQALRELEQDPSQA